MKNRLLIIFMFALCALTTVAACLQQTSDAATTYYMDVYYSINGGSIRTDLDDDIQKSFYGKYSNTSFPNTAWYVSYTTSSDTVYVGLDHPSSATALAINARSDGYIVRGVASTLQHANVWNVASFGWYKTGYHIESTRAWKAVKNGVTNYFNENDTSDSNTVNPVTAYRLNGNQNMTKHDSVILYANWILNTYNITYDANGGYNAPSAQTKDHFTDITLSQDKPSRKGYRFVEWNTEEDGSGISYDPGESYSSEEDLTLYAQWELRHYTITYDLDGGTVSPQNPGSYTVLTSSFTLNNPVKTGYTFKGWKGGFVNSATGYSTTVTIKKGSTGNLNYKAYWEKITKELTYYDNGHGSITGDNPVVMDYFDAVTAKSMDNTDEYRFKGWAKTQARAEAGTVDYKEGSVIKPANKNPNSTSYPSSLYAVWVEMIYKADVSYHAGGGTINSGIYSLNDDMVAAGGSNVVQEVYASDEYFDLHNTGEFGLVRTGYHTEADRAWKLGNASRFFHEDQTSAGGVNPVTAESLNDGTELTDDISVILYANWIPNTYSVRFNANGGSGPAYIQTGFSYDRPKNLADISDTGISAPAGAGGKWAFAGWSADPAAAAGYANKASVMNLSETNESIVDLYAVWRRPVVFKSGTAPKASSAGYQYYNSDGVTSVSVPSDIVTEIGNSWSFEGWRADTSAEAAAVEGENGASIAPAADTSGSGTNYELYAVYSRAVYLKYEGSGAEAGATSDSDELTQYYNSGGGSTVSKPCFTHAANGFEKTGYSFEKWDKHDAADTGKYTWGPARDSGILYDTAAAVWKADTYVISFDPNGGSFPYDELEVTYDSSDHNDPGAASLNGQVFQGWYTSNNEMVFDTEGSCVEGSFWKNGKWHSAKDITVYAHWEEGKSFRVMFSVGKSGSSAPEEGSAAAASDLDAGELDNVKGEGHQYELYRDIVPDGVQSSEPSLKLFGPSSEEPSANTTKKYHTRSLAFQPGGIVSGYHCIGSMGIAGH